MPKFSDGCITMVTGKQNLIVARELGYIYVWKDSSCEMCQVVEVSRLVTEVRIEGFQCEEGVCELPTSETPLCQVWGASVISSNFRPSNSCSTQQVKR